MRNDEVNQISHRVYLYIYLLYIISIFKTITYDLIDPSKVITAMTQGVQNYWGERAAMPIYLNIYLNIFLFIYLFFLFKIMVKLVEQEVYRICV